MMRPPPRATLCPYTTLCRSMSGRLASFATGAVVSCTCTAWVWLLWLPSLSEDAQVLQSPPQPDGPLLFGTPEMSPPSPLSVSVVAVGRTPAHLLATLPNVCY